MGRKGTWMWGSALQEGPGAGVLNMQNFGRGSAGQNGK